MIDAPPYAIADVQVASEKIPTNALVVVIVTVSEARALTVVSSLPLMVNVGASVAVMVAVGEGVAVAVLVGASVGVVAAAVITRSASVAPIPPTLAVSPEGISAGRGDVVDSAKVTVHVPPLMLAPT
jgi:hypothetical protein